MPIEIHTTIYNNNQRSEKTEHAEFVTDRDVEYPVINLHPQVKYQTFQGFGGMFTEAAAYTLSQVGEAVYDRVIQDFFGEDGLRYTCGRVHLDSCDACLSNYSAMDDPADENLDSFSIKRDEKYLIPMIKKAQKVCSRPLALMVSPWSPPPFMKTNGERNRGGFLRPGYRELWAKYICRFIKEYQKHGIGFSMLSLQNEPKAVQKWDSCVYTAAEEREFIRSHLAPELKRHGLGDIQLLIWDHNKERALERALETINDREMDGLISGIAVHWYSGDHFEQLDMIGKLYPGKRILFTEGCVEYSKFGRDDHLAHARMYAHDIIGDLNSGVDCFIHWSLVFDENGGPNHVNNLCEAIVMCDTRNNTYQKTLPYYYISHFSRFIRPGAVRIGFSRFADKLEVTAFLNESGEKVAVVLNKTGEDIPYVLREGDCVCKRISPGDSIATLIIPAGA